MAGTRREAAAEDDAVLTRIGQAVMLHRAGDREEARNRLGGLWVEIGEHGTPLHRCTLAHYLADTQDDPAAKLRWDLLALAAAQGRGQDPRDGGALRAFHPALHLHLADDYLSLGRLDAARAQLRLARASAGVLRDDPHGHRVRAAIGGLARRLDRAGGGRTPPRAGGEAG
ncbi:hypothetical protein [Streptomyces palmae]|uniref:Tetratricopeptide repeat protein n=1 Tax=Streptomyces palmae TaxID=1701085 RepID=A0A4Z0HH24_9ACTN|nr:hypothetical protein [Streptomyces palmae]TGB15605.1 hypothetical protein E4099_06490 [Streptomyces palmae]